MKCSLAFHPVILLVISLGTLSSVLIPIYALEKKYDINEDNLKYFRQTSQIQTAFNTTLPQQNESMSKSVHVELSTSPTLPVPGNETQINIIFMNNNMRSIQRHVDYKVSIMRDSNQVFAILLSHSTDGLASIPYRFQEAGEYQVIIEVDDVYFLPIPAETTMFPIVVGNLQNTSQTFHPSSQTYVVSITNGSGSSQNCVLTRNCFYPQLIKIIEGSTVIWTNNDTIAHTVTSGNASDVQTGNIFSSNLIPSGKTFSFTFYETNEYNYFCQVHPWMTGQIIVVNNTSNLSNSTIPEFPLILPILSASFFSLIIFYKLKLRV